MLDLLLSIVPGGSLTAILAAVVAALGWGFHQRLAGARKERDKQAADRLRARTEADKIDDAIAGRDANSNRDALKKWAKHFD